MKQSRTLPNGVMSEDWHVLGKLMICALFIFNGSVTDIFSTTNLETVIMAKGQPFLDTDDYLSLPKNTSVLLVCLL